MKNCVSNLRNNKYLQLNVPNMWGATTYFLRLQLVFMSILSMNPISEVVASEARTSILGTNTVRDHTDLFSFPTAVIGDEFVLAEIGSSGGTSAYGLVSKNVGGGQLAVAFSRAGALLTAPEYGSSLSIADAWLAGNQSNTDQSFLLPALERPIEIIYGGKFDGNMMAVGISLAGYKNSSDNGKGPTVLTSNEADQMLLNFGYVIPGVNPIELSFKATLVGEIRRKTKTAASTTENGFDESTNNFRIAARSFRRDGSFVSGRLDSRKIDLMNSTATTDKKATIKETMFVVTGGKIIKPTSVTQLSFSLGLGILNSEGPVVPTPGKNAAPSFVTSDEVVTLSTKAMTGRVGLESMVSESFGILGGVDYNLWGTVVRTDKITTNEPKSETSVPETTDASLWKLGVYYRSGDLRADAIYSRNFLFAGPSFINNDARVAGNTLLAQISLTYLM